MKDFRELKVWQMGMALFEEVVNDVEQFPKTESKCASRYVQC